MAENKGDPIKTEGRITDETSAESLRKGARHEGEGEARRDVADEDVGQDRIMQKGIGGEGADDSSVGPRRDPPLSDNNSSGNRQ
jgi:hypothetical protein